MFIQQKANSMRTETVLLASVSKNPRRILGREQTLKKYMSNRRKTRKDGGRKGAEGKYLFIHP